MAKETGMRIGMKANGPMKMRQHGNSKAGMNGKETTMMSMDISKDKERKERKEKEKKGKGKRRKVMDLKIKEKDKGDGKGGSKLCDQSREGFSYWWSQEAEECIEEGIAEG